MRVILQQAEQLAGEESDAVGAGVTLTLAKPAACEVRGRVQQG